MKKAFTNEDILRFEIKHKNGFKIKRNEQIYHQNMYGVKKANLSYIYNDNEMETYTEVRYNPMKLFEINNYKLFNIQERAVKHFYNNKFPIFMNSRQTGIDMVLENIILYEAMFNGSDRRILVMYKCEMDIHDYYKKLPFFLKRGVYKYNRDMIKFDNNTVIKFVKPSKYAVIGENYDIIYLKDYAYYPQNVQDNLLKSIFPIVAAQVKSKLVISSTPNGNNNFIKLIQDSERKEGDPQKNIFSTIRNYWWEIPNRDEYWVNHIKEKYGVEFFNQEYDLKF
jgi:hypothetical protein